MKVLSGVYPYGSYEGQIVYQGEERRFARIADSEHLGIIIIHQELALVPLLSIAENIFLGNEPAKMGVIDWGEAFNRTRELLAKVGLKESPNALITNLGIGKQQLVEIAKALAKKVKLLILDEPTASLNETDSDALLKLLVEFKGQGITSIIISHKLNELAKVADKITVHPRRRDGGDDRLPRREDQRGPHHQEHGRARNVGPLSAARAQDRRATVRDQELARRASAARRARGHQGRRSPRQPRRGRRHRRADGRRPHRTRDERVRPRLWPQRAGPGLHGRQGDRHLRRSRRRSRAGIAYVTEDRKSLGLVLSEDIKNNVTLANLPGIAWRGVIDDHREQKVAKQYRDLLKIRSSGIFQKTVNLSGGNQQKVVLSKWLFAQPQVLILDEPTRGIDVGAKYEIYGIVNDLAAAGKGVIVISSEMPELLGICDRIYVMNEGRFVDEMPAKGATQEKIMASIMKQYGVAA